MSPLVGEFHQQFWDNSRSTNAPPVHIGRGGYPIWEASSITPSLFGMIGAWIDTKIAQFKWHRALHRRVILLDAERRLVLLRTLDALESPTYLLAQRAVRATATTIGFTHPQAWKTLSMLVKSNAGRTQNMYRHQNACQIVRDAAAKAGSTVTGPHQHLVVELAYQGFTLVDARPKMAGSA